MPKLLSFNQAISKSEIYSNRHAMLGNGFSIACRPDIFVYGKPPLPRAWRSGPTDIKHGTICGKLSSDANPIFNIFKIAKNHTITCWA